MFPIYFIWKFYMTTCSVTIVGPIAIPQTDAPPDFVGGWLTGFASLRSGL